MGTRAGDLDPAIPFFLARATGRSAEQIEALLNTESGLKGICGVNDMRTIQRRAEEGDERSRLAMDMYAYRVRKYIGAYVAMLGGADAIVEARRIRKMFGGGMRQAGIIAAAGLVALDEVMPLLGEDNRRALALAVGLADIPAVVLDPDTVETNIVFFSLADDAPMDAGALAARLAEDGLLCHPLGGDSIRMVTHYHISDDDVARAIEMTSRVLQA